MVVTVVSEVVESRSGAQGCVTDGIMYRDWKQDAVICCGVVFASPAYTKSRYVSQELETTHTPRRYVSNKGVLLPFRDRIWLPLGSPSPKTLAVTLRAEQIMTNSTSSFRVSSSCCNNSPLISSLGLTPTPYF